MVLSNLEPTRTVSIQWLMLALLLLNRMLIIERASESELSKTDIDQLRALSQVILNVLENPYMESGDAQALSQTIKEMLGK